MARLLLMQKNGPLKQVELAGERTRLGRGASNDLRIDHPQVSRQHAELRVEGSTTWVVDLQSRNGTLVNGHPVKQWALRHGDVVRIGDCDIRVLTRHASAEVPELALAD